MEALLKSGYLCNPQQACSLRRVTISEGKGKGANLIEVATAGGLQVDILVDSGMDIGQVRYKGTNMTLITKNGYDSPARFSACENEFLKTFPGGLMYTCGLLSAGGGNRDNGEWHPLHGRYHGIPADHVAAYVEDDTVIIRGTVRETALFGEALELKRTIRIPVFGSAITVDDEITNQTPGSQEYMLLYHCNFGYPMVSEKAHLELPENRKTTPRSPYAATAVGKEHTFIAPVPGEEEQCFFHEQMERKVALVNPEVGAKMTLSWSETLPILVEWRTMASGDYGCGLEPTSSYINGRHGERENGTLPVLAPYSSIKTQVKFEFTDV